METTKIVEFLLSYGLQTFIIALITSIIDYVAEKTFCKNAPRFIKNFAPFVITILLMVAYDMIFTYKQFIFNFDSLYKGIVAGSLSTIISVCGKKIANGEKITESPTSLLIEGLLEGYIPEENKQKAVDKIVELVSEFDSKNLEGKDLNEKLTLIIKQYAKTILDDKDLNEIVKIIANTIKEKNIK